MQDAKRELDMDRLGILESVGLGECHETLAGPRDGIQRRYLERKGIPELGCRFQPRQVYWLPGCFRLLLGVVSGLLDWACPHLPPVLPCSPVPLLVFCPSQRKAPPTNPVVLGLILQPASSSPPPAPPVRKCGKRKRVAGQDERTGGWPQRRGRLRCGCSSGPREGAGDERSRAAGGTEADVALPLLGRATDPC